MCLGYYPFPFQPQNQAIEVSILAIVVGHCPLILDHLLIGAIAYHYHHYLDHLLIGTIQFL